MASDDGASPEDERLRAALERIEALERRVETNERLLSKAIATTALAGRFAEHLYGTVVRHAPEGERYGIGMSMRPVASSLSGALSDLQRAVESVRGE